jgi:phage tail sheath protein FI
MIVEKSIKSSTSFVVFEPNDANTWTRLRAMIENFLTLQWRSGALAGAKPDEAFYVRVGLNETMTSLDILEGRIIVEVGMAMTRPAEFTIIRFSHTIVTS